jgi:DNA/RNA-binding domain of Phe-tRNA-synthetase-like protein
MNLRIHAEIEADVLAGVAWFAGVDAAEENPFWEEMESLAESMRRAYGGRAPAEIDGLEPARRLYRTFGVDPTRTRPSSEALLRRVLKGRALYRVNRLVDACNWASLAMLLPVGLYDMNSIQDDMEIRVGKSGESFEGIRKGEVHVEGRLAIADSAGAFGSPTSDSYRTKITPETTRALAVVFAPGDFSRLQMEEGVTRLVEQVNRWCGGTEDGALILGGREGSGSSV